MLPSDRKRRIEIERQVLRIGNKLVKRQDASAGERLVTASMLLNVLAARPSSPIADKVIQLVRSIEQSVE